MNIGLGELSSVFRIPRQWILLERTVLLLTGLCTHLDPAIRPMELLRPYLRDFVLGEEPDWSAFAVETGKDALFRAIGLPAELHKLIVRANMGRLEVRVVGLESGARRMYALGHQVLFTLVGITSAVIATIFHVHGDVSARDAALEVTWIAGGLVLFSMLREWRRGRA
jgi:predicted unusual protein kinase regulating ubiquinone biosynthesis (AarF/ABC1/UbiB family)